VVKYNKVGIISTDESGIITLMNNPACELLQIVKHKSWTDLKNARPSFANEVEKINKSGAIIVKIDFPSCRKNLSVHVSTIKLQDEPYRLITIQDVQNEVEKGEIDATHRLIRVLTHEIMNSITPISSLTETISMLLESEEGLEKEISEITPSNISDIRKSAISIQERVDGLDHFIREYRKLSQLPKLPDLKRLKINELFEKVMNLMSGELQKSNIKLILDIPDKNMGIFADSHLLEQVLINLMGNSIEALQDIEGGEIRMIAGEEEEGPFIRIIDNGKGIAPDEFDQIFVPFYSTKEGGSGIGLSLSRQIMRLHGGNISVQSKPEKETVFTLKFKNG
ncbi:MAG: HAMP domain-containing histidine kinase, partial [Bacteroidales bacterium]